jgi:hypothetical protein
MEAAREAGVHVFVDKIMKEHGGAIVNTVVQKVTADIRAKLFGYIKIMTNQEASNGLMASYHRAPDEDRWVNQMSRLYLAMEDPQDRETIFELIGMMDPEEQDQTINFLENNKISQFFGKIGKFFQRLNQSVNDKLHPINEAVETGLSNSKTAKGIRTDDIFSKMRDGLR